MGELTTSKVNKAGQRLRRALRGENVSLEQFDAAVDVLLAFRSQHVRPLTTATMGVRSAVSSIPEARVSQRLKRIPTILDKLERQPTLPLSRMQDIGGCRAVVPSIAELRKVQRRIERPTKAREYVATSDYIATPRSSGYRGVHVIVRYAGCSIEVQLRTPHMHAWALAVEDLSARYGEDYKSHAEGVVGDWLSLVSAAMAMDEIGKPVPSELSDEIDRQRILVLEHWASEGSQ